MPTVSVAIISHNYGSFLAEAIASVLAQSLRPVEVLVIDDASTDNTAAVANDFAQYGVRYARVDTGNVLVNRLRAIDQLRGEWVLCLDADNTIPPHYLREAVRVGAADPACGIVYPMLNRFGESRGLIDFAEPLPITSANYIDAGAVYRREAVMQSDVAGIEVDCMKTAEDWLMARRVLSAGWTAHKNSVPLNYRLHSHNKHCRRLARTREYFDDAGLAKEPVTIVVPLSGRTGPRADLFGWLDRQTWPRSQCRLLLVDNSHNAEFGQWVRGWIAQSDYDDCRYVRSTAGEAGMADRARTNQPDHNRAVNRIVASIYNRAIAESTTEYVLTIEDDVIPESDNAIESLFRGMGQRVAGVTGAYYHRDGIGIIAWWGLPQQHDMPTEIGEGIQQVDGCGFGCLLLRKSVFSKFRLTSDGPTMFYDCNAAGTLRQLGWSLHVNWNVICDHQAEVL